MIASTAGSTARSTRFNSGAEICILRSQTHSFSTTPHFWLYLPNAEMTLDLEANEVEVKVLTSLASVTESTVPQLPRHPIWANLINRGEKLAGSRRPDYEFEEICGSMGRPSCLLTDLWLKPLCIQASAKSTLRPKATLLSTSHGLLALNRSLHEKTKNGGRRESVSFLASSPSTSIRLLPLR